MSRSQLATTTQTGRTVEASSARGVDYTTELLFSEMRPGCLRARESALQMDLHNLIPLLIREVLEPKPSSEPSFNIL